jgi:hypothetical protein
LQLASVVASVAGHQGQHQSGRSPVDQMQFMRFNGKTWERFGELQTGN